MLAATCLAGLVSTSVGPGQGALVASPVPPIPTAGQIDQSSAALANPLNQPITGAARQPQVTGGETPPSLEQLQATRPGDEQSDGLDRGRGDQLHQSA
ncbi:MAG: conjugal transfer protein TraI, partial [Aliidongia sp.]